MPPHAHEAHLRAFEDFKRHANQDRNQYEAERDTLRQLVKQEVTRIESRAYRYCQGEIEPVLTLADRTYLSEMRVYV